MPRGDRTGLISFGPATGRAAGFCRGFAWPGYLNKGFGGRCSCMPWGFSGRGRGHRFWFYATGLPFWARMNPSMYPGMPLYCQPFPSVPYPMSKEAEIEFLKRHAEGLEATLEQIQRRLSELTEQEKDGA